ncbi:MAG: hypothetical protein M1838_001339 [Thelocarpon superellum]|nr:MAG: hypothetical protein M1838_001339 [Thelocarpon superellum]
MTVLLSRSICAPAPAPQNDCPAPTGDEVPSSTPGPVAEQYWNFTSNVYPNFTNGVKGECEGHSLQAVYTAALDEMLSGPPSPGVVGIAQLCPALGNSTGEAQVLLTGAFYWPNGTFWQPPPCT